MTQNIMVTVSEPHRKWLEAQKEKGAKRSPTALLRKAIQEEIDAESGLIAKREEVQEDLEYAQANIKKFQNLLAAMNKAIDSMPESVRNSYNHALTNIMFPPRI